MNIAGLFFLLPIAVLAAMFMDEYKDNITYCIITNPDGEIIGKIRIAEYKLCNIEIKPEYNIEQTTELLPAWDDRDTFHVVFLITCVVCLAVFTFVIKPG